MTLQLPDVSTTLEKLMTIQSTFRNKTQSIEEWVKEHREDTKTNLRLTQERSDENDMEVLRIFLRELVMTVSGNAGEKLRLRLDAIVKTKADLTTENFERALTEAGYRWGAEKGSSIMVKVVTYFRDTLNWNWQAYLEKATPHAAKETNFHDDPLIREISGVDFKVRDLALSNFNENYAAFDLHVIRVVARTGLVGYGWALLKDEDIDFGTHPKRHYLFFRRLFIELARLSGRFTPVDLDRIFWHFGKTVCDDSPKCRTCHIRHVCLTGKQRQP